MSREAEIIQLFVRSGPAGTVTIGDDCAVLPDGTLLTTDTMIEGTHWDARLSPEDVGAKLAAVNLSDIAAMGGAPRWALLNLALPDADLAWVGRFRDGLFSVLDRFQTPLIGGDTVRAPIRSVSLTIGGHAERPILRSGAKLGHDLWVSGALGFAAEGFFAAHPSERARLALARPTPRLSLGEALVGLASAMMDLSDGLHTDLCRLCVASGVSADVWPDKVPGAALLAHRLAFGEDYELLFAAPPEARSAVESRSSLTATPVSRIGLITASGPPRLIGTDWPDPLFSHFPPEPPEIAR